MKSSSVRQTLRGAYDAVEGVCEEHPDVERELGGICDQLRHAVEGGRADPEAVVGIERGALDTIQWRIGEVIDESGDPEVVETLGRAREAILLAVVTLEDRWKKQH